VGSFRLNSCPRCKGDIILGNTDEYGWYEQCLQCGYVHDHEIIVQVERQPATAKKMTKACRRKRVAQR
jgi:hypothetical protein